jgi:hypothetical protein
VVLDLCTSPDVFPAISSECAADFMRCAERAWRRHYPAPDGFLNTSAH